MLANLHAVDPAAVGSPISVSPADISSARCGAGAPNGSLCGCPTTTARRRRAASAFGSARAIPEQSRTSIVHGDYRIDNTILDSDDATRVRAVLDWEMSTLGDPLSDAALMCVYRHPMFDLVHAFDAAWTSAAAAVARGNGPPLFGDLRAAVGALGVLHVAGVFQAGDHRRRIDYRARMGGSGPDNIGEAVAPLIEAGIDALKA